MIEDQAKRSRKSLDLDVPTFVYRPCVDKQTRK